jgi:transforming growth factor-beta-induced protein
MYFLYMSDQKNNMTMIISGVVIVVVVAVIGIVAYNSMNKNTSSSSSSSSSSVDAMMKSSEATVMVGGEAMYPSKNVVENASKAPNLSTVVAAVKAAGLVETLSGPGPFTVFAPTNKAFDKLPAGTVTDLLKPENKAKLTSILTYHVVSGKILSSDLIDGQTLKTVNGESLKVVKKDGKFTINGAMIETADVLQSNGVAHVIDTVLLPSSDQNASMVGGASMYPSKNIVQNVSNASNLTTVVAAVKAAGLVDALSAAGPLTVFGPDNAAFEKLPAGTVTDLLKPENKAKLTAILTYHVVSGRLTIADLTDGKVLTTLNGGKLTVKRDGNKIMLIGGDSKNVATIITPDVLQSNGVAHVIDTVLLPASN